MLSGTRNVTIWDYTFFHIFFIPEPVQHFPDAHKWMHLCKRVWYICMFACNWCCLQHQRKIYTSSKGMKKKNITYAGQVLNLLLHKQMRAMHRHLPHVQDSLFITLISSMSKLLMPSIMQVFPLLNGWSQQSRMVSY